MEHDKLLDFSAELGYRLMACGAEIYRVEESIRRILTAYGLPSGEVFAIPNLVIVSAADEGARPLTRIRRVSAHGIDIDLLERYNDLCRHLCAETPPIEEACERLEKLSRTRRSYSVGASLAAHFGGAAAFSLFFGGAPADAVCGGLCGLVIWLCLAVLTRFGANSFLATIACGAASTLLALSLTAWGIGGNSDAIIIGALMLLVPGIAFTNAMRDIMAGDTVSGIAKTVDALLVGVAIALGTGGALWLAGFLWR